TAAPDWCRSRPDRPAPRGPKGRRQAGRRTSARARLVRLLRPPLRCTGCSLHPPLSGLQVLRLVQSSSTPSECPTAQGGFAACPPSAALRGAATPPWTPYGTTTRGNRSTSARVSDTDPPISW